MVLFCCAGELGCGKTLTLTFLSWKNWFYRKKKIFSNYHLFRIPYIFIDSVEKLEEMREGFFCADEFWLWVDSRCSGSARNKIVTNILLKSRKRELTYAYTSQTLEQLDKRVRKIQDFTATPMLNIGETVCKVLVFRTGYPKAGNYMRTFYFKTGLIFECYDHREEVQVLGEGEIDSQIIFQESKESQPIVFKTWEEADKYGENWWLKEYRQLKGLI